MGWNTMASRALARRSRALVLLAALCGCCYAISALMIGFVPSPVSAPPKQVSPAAAALTVLASSAASMPAFAVDDEEGFDPTLLLVLALPLTGASWALYNVWRVGFRQLTRIGESENGSSKFGLGAED